ncbi:9563_t:CDS:2, partial [Gigaspora rosea]
KNTFQVNLKNIDSNSSQENITNNYQNDDALSVLSDNLLIAETSAKNQEPHFEEQEQHFKEEQEQHFEEEQEQHFEEKQEQHSEEEQLKLLESAQSKRHFQNRHKENYDRIQQSTLLMQNVEPYESRDERKVKRLNGLLIRWIICDQQAFQVVENNDFCKLISALDPRFRVPTRQTIFDHVLLAMTVDTWSACTNQAYFSITLHWINDDWCMQCILLDLIPLHECYTGVFIAENIIEQVEYFGLGAQLLFLNADNATNMDACGRHLANLLQSRYNNTNFCRVRCASHILNLAVKEGISVLDGFVKKAREFTSHIQRSQPCFEELKKVFIMKNKQFLVPDLDVDTRWNSIYIMLNKLCRIREIIDILVVSLPNPTKLLSSSSHPTLGDLRTVFYVIMEILDDAQIELDSVKGRIAKKISNKINHYWDELQLYFYEAVLLDPSTKFTTFESDTQKHNALLKIRSTYQNYLPSEKINTILQVENQTQIASARDYFKQQIKQIRRNSSVLHNDVLEEYLNAPDEDVNVLTYWKSKSLYLRWAPLTCMP